MATLPNPFSYPQMQRRRDLPNGCFAIALQNLFPYSDFIETLKKAKITDGVAFWESHYLFGLPFAAVFDGEPLEGFASLQYMLNFSLQLNTRKTLAFAIRQRLGSEWHFVIVLVKDGHTCEINSLNVQMRSYPSYSPICNAIYVLMDTATRRPRELSDIEIAHLLCS